MPEPWDPESYLRFKEQRAQPFYDLLNLVQPVPGGSVVDLGCGTGELSRTLHQHTGAAATLGLDSSEAMLAASKSMTAPGLSFELGDIGRFQPTKPFDVVFSNAAIQWVLNHDALFPRLLGWVAPGGQVAIQLPDNDDHLSHVIARELALEEPFRSASGGYVTPWPVLPPERYAEMLDAAGFTTQNVSLRVYPHHLHSREAVFDWVRSAYLTDLSRHLPPALFETYLQRYRERLTAALPDISPIFFPYRRILIWAQRPK